MKPRRRPPVTPEKVEQAHIKQLLETLGAKVYVLGNHRRKGDFAGTMQTPGLPDLQAFVPRTFTHFNGAPFCGKCRHLMNGQGGMCTALDGACRCVCEADTTYELLFIEAKASSGRLRPEQRELQTFCRQAGVAHVVGTYDAVVAWLIERGYATRKQFPAYRLPAQSTPQTAPVRRRPTDNA